MDLSGFPPEYVNASNAGRIVGVVGVFCFLALVFVSLRVYVRVFMVRAFGVDDGLILAASALALMSWICLILQIPYGLGRHGVVVPVEDRIKFEHISFWKTVFSDGVAMGLLRISMAISLLRLKPDLKWYRWSLFAVIAFVVAYSIQAIAWLFVYCKPYSGWWEFQWMNPFDPRCHDFTVFVNLTYWNIACNIFTDVVLGALPIPIIWSLKMKLRLRLYVIGILNLGYLSVLMGILKAIYMLTTGGDPDAIFDYWVHFWQNLQLNIGIIAACASFLKPLVGRILKINSSVGYSYSNNPYNRSGRTPKGTGGATGNKYASNNRSRRAAGGSHVDGFELQTQNGIGAEDGEPQVVARVHATRSGSHEYSSTEAVGGGVPSDTNSEEIILQKQETGRGIMMTRNVTVQYSRK
ncbi:hypothetical protein VTI74DRAFT_8758 [Chaetomium olivicolor]